MKNRTKIILLSVGVLSVGLAVWFWTRSKSKMPITYEFAEVTRGNLSTAVTATGTIEPVTQVEVGTQVSGIVNKLHVDYNSVVKKGQLIAELDKTNLLNDLASKTSNLENSKTEYDYQTKNYNRVAALYDKKMVSEADYETAYYDYAKSKNNYDIAKIQLATSQTNLGYATIYSPISGVVLSRAVEEGQTVNAGMSTPTLFVIAADLTDMRVIADVDEADIGEVRKGLHVTFSVDAYPGVTFEGRVEQVRQEAKTTSNVVTYEVVVSAPNPDLKLKPGMTANISIYTIERDSVLIIPSKSLKYTPVAGPMDSILDCDAPHKVWVKERNLLKAYPVTIGVSTGSQIEVVNGLSEGMRIITQGVEGQMPTSATTTQSPTGASEERSPFMPGPPGGKAK